MTGHLAITLGFMLTAVASLGTETAAAAADGPRPNILFACADDWGRYAGAYAKLDGPGTINDVSYGRRTSTASRGKACSSAGHSRPRRAARRAVARCCRASISGAPGAGRSCAAPSGTGLNRPSRCRWKAHFEWACGKRPREELYGLKADPHQAKEVAADPTYAQARAALERQLLDELKRASDPRLVDDGRFFETPPMSGPVADRAPAATRKG